MAADTPAPITTRSCDENTHTHTHSQLHLFACDVSVAGVSFNQLQFAVYGDWQTAAESIKFRTRNGNRLIAAFLFLFPFRFVSFTFVSILPIIFGIYIYTFPLRVVSVRPPTGE